MNSWKDSAAWVMCITEHALLQMTVDMLTDVQKNWRHSDQFLLDLLTAKQAIKKLLPYF